MTTKTDGDRLLRAAVAALSAPGWGNRANSEKALLDVVESIAPGRVERARNLVKRKRAEAAEARRFQGNPPLWAKNLMNKHAPRYSLQWRRSRVKGYSSGRTYRNFLDPRVVVTAGMLGDFAEDEAKAVLIHEIAHTMTAGGHDDDFWDAMYRVAKAENHVAACRSRSSHSFAAAMRRARKQAAS